MAGLVTNEMLVAGRKWIEQNVSRFWTSDKTDNEWNWFMNGIYQAMQDAGDTTEQSPFVGLKAVDDDMMERVKAFGVMAPGISQWPHEDVASLNKFYGDPRGANGEPSAAWESANLVRWTPPYPMYYSDGKHTPLLHFRVHKKTLSTFDAAFKEALSVLGHDYIVEHHLDICGGTYCYRLERGGSRLSVHSWGCAVDLDPAHNPFPHQWVEGKGMLDKKFAEILMKHGFDWRGANRDIDAMHFQTARH